jgi:hypothetical protein
MARTWSDSGSPPTPMPTPCGGRRSCSRRRR